MDSWFKDLRATTIQDLAKTAQKQVSDLQQRGSQLTEKLATLTASSKKDCEFDEGPLGFELEGNLVVVVEEGSQAERQNVQVGDRLVEVDGYKVPKYKEGDLASEEAASAQLRKWLKEMPRPCRLTFKPPKAAEMAAAAATDFDLEDSALFGLSMDIDDLLDLKGDDALAPGTCRPSAAEPFQVGGGPEAEPVEEHLALSPGTAEAEKLGLGVGRDGQTAKDSDEKDHSNFEIGLDAEGEASNAFDLLPLDGLVGDAQEATNAKDQSKDEEVLLALPSTDESVPSDGAPPGGADLVDLEVLLSQTDLGPPQPQQGLPTSTSSQPTQGLPVASHPQPASSTASAPEVSPSRTGAHGQTAATNNSSGNRSSSNNNSNNNRRGAQDGQDDGEVSAKNGQASRLTKEKEKLLEQTQAKLENERKTTARLLQELAVSRAKTKELQKSQSKWEAKEKSLAEEVTRLSGLLSGLQGAEGDAARLASELSAALQKSAKLEDQLSELQVTASAAQEEKEEAVTRAAYLETSSEQLRAEVERLEVQLDGFQAAHEAELELLREEQEELVRRERRRQHEQEAAVNQRVGQAQAEIEAARRQEQEARQALEETKAEAEAVSAESLAARAALREVEAERTALRERLERLERDRPKALFGGAEGEGAPTLDLAERGEADPVDIAVTSLSLEEQQHLQERLGLLERKCVTLQQRLHAQVLQARASGPAGQGHSHPPWLQPLIERLGPQTGVLALAAFSSVDKALRTLTQLIMQRSTWLWLFYVHLIVLYSIVASVTLTSGADPSTTVAVLGQQMTQADLSSSPSPPKPPAPAPP